MAIKSVKVPDPMVPLFEKGEDYVRQYFSSYKADHDKGTITVGNERYILVRAKSLRLDFEKHFGAALGLPEDMAREASERFLYILGRSLGQEDAGHFIQVQGVTDPVAKLAAGPIHFNYTGWAFVDIFAESRPSPDKDYFLVYDHPYSFECDSYLTAEKAKSERPVCIMNAGYSAGWCSTSFGVDLEAREIMCRARGDKACRFVMGVSERLDEYEQWVNDNIKR